MFRFAVVFLAVAFVFACRSGTKGGQEHHRNAVPERGEGSDTKAATSSATNGSLDWKAEVRRQVREATLACSESNRSHLNGRIVASVTVRAVGSALDVSLDLLDDSWQRTTIAEGSIIECIRQRCHGLDRLGFAGPGEHRVTIPLSALHHQ
jgi:hypothetical protein